MEIPDLKSATETKKLLCYADNILERTKSIEETEVIIKRLDKLKVYGLNLNMDKSQILGNLPCLGDQIEILSC